MIFKHPESAKKLFSNLVDSSPSPPGGHLDHVVDEVLSQKNRLLHHAQKHQTPYYLFLPTPLYRSLTEFQSCFSLIPNHQPYYAVKSNDYPPLLRRLLRADFGLDVSSGRELKIALTLNAQKIVFTGPGKTEADLALAVAHPNQIIVHLDSFAELHRLGAISRQSASKITAAVRIYTPAQGNWSKFGIALDQLTEFWRQSQSFPNLSLQGIHCHNSWNETVSPYQDTIRLLSRYLKANFSNSMLKQLKFIDLGGGFWPHRQNGSYPADFEAGEAALIASKFLHQKVSFSRSYYLSPAPPLSRYAQAIRDSLATHLFPLIDNLAIFTEPGRIVSTGAMAIIVRIIDIKSPKSVIVDGGINLIGGSQLESQYVPVINLSRPSSSQIPLQILGSLCTPSDTFGYYCYSQPPEIGDILIIPNQGAYTYSRRQSFIKGIAPVYSLPR